MPASSHAIATVHKLWVEYQKKPKPRPERFGQFVCNRMNITHNILFYATDDNEAFTLACLVVPQEAKP